MTIRHNSTCSANIRHSDHLRERHWASLPCPLFYWWHSSVRPAPQAFFRPDHETVRPPRAGAVKAGRVLCGHPQGLALIGPSTVACSIGLGLEAANCPREWGRSITVNFNPLKFSGIHAAGNNNPRFLHLPRRCLSTRSKSAIGHLCGSSIARRGRLSALPTGLRAGCAGRRAPELQQA